MIGKFGNLMVKQTLAKFAHFFNVRVCFTNGYLINKDELEKFL